MKYEDRQLLPTSALPRELSQSPRSAQQESKKYLHNGLSEITVFIFGHYNITERECVHFNRRQLCQNILFLYSQQERILYLLGKNFCQ